MGKLFILPRWKCFQINGEDAKDGIVEVRKPLMDSASKPWALQSIQSTISPDISVEEVKRVFDNGQPEEHMQFAASFFELKVNGNMKLRTPLYCIHIVGFSSFSPHDHTFNVNWNDEVRLKIDFWDKKPHSIVVNVVFYQREIKS